MKIITLSLCFVVGLFACREAPVSQIENPHQSTEVVPDAVYQACFEKFKASFFARYPYMKKRFKMVWDSSSHIPSVEVRKSVLTVKPGGASRFPGGWLVRLENLHEDGVSVANYKVRRVGSKYFAFAEEIIKSE